MRNLNKTDHKKKQSNEESKSSPMPFASNRGEGTVDIHISINGDHEEAASCLLFPQRLAVYAVQCFPDPIHNFLLFQNYGVHVKSD